MQNYKHTLNLPKTDFPMKGNLPRTEPAIIKKWQDIKLHKLQVKNSTKPFVLIDGPPYANGELHMGHVLNKVLKDIVIKYKNMTGHSAQFVPGWDCHGLPIEHIVTKKINNNNTDQQIRALCREEALKWVEIQKEQFKRFGVLAFWDTPYLTLDREYEACQMKVLSDLVKKNLIYRGEKAVYWCYALQTSLAEAEIEYMDRESPSIYARFEVVKNSSFEFENLNLLIWTTTPWTIPANRAHAVSSEFDYGVYKLDKFNVVVACKLKDQIEKTIGKTLESVSRPFKGDKLLGLKTKHIMYPKIESPVVLGDHVTLDVGTGIVHTAPGHGQEDFELGKANGLEIFSPVDEFGRYTNQVKEFRGIHVFDANKLLIKKFKDSGHLIFSHKITHSYPHCWRSKTPVIFRTTPQWFIKMDEESLNIRNETISKIPNVGWIPTWGQNRISSMIETRPDWCISRQRVWGVPLPTFHCIHCDKAYIFSETIDKLSDLFRKGEGIEEYWKTDIEKILNKNIKCCNKRDFKKGKDILDVWFDSGVAWAFAKQKHDFFPADLYLEGSDQHRGWFHTSLLTAIASKKAPPYKQVLTHGFVMFSKGVKMSKSKGNVINPQDIIKKDGAEILRLWASHEDYTQDINCNPESFDRLKETYRRIRNTMRFILGNINDFDSNKMVPYEKLNVLEKWMLYRLNNLISLVKENYESYEFFRIYHQLSNFFSIDLSSLYLDIIKDRLYTSKKDGVARRSSQTVLLILADNLARLMAPILSFLSEEVYEHLPNKTKKSVFLAGMPSTNLEWGNLEIARDFELIFSIREKAKKKLEELRDSKQIGSSLEARLVIVEIEKNHSVLKKYADILSEIFIVSDLELMLGEQKISALNASGKKCIRCWKVSTAVVKEGDICGRCIDALK